MKMLTMDPLWDIKRSDALRLICDFFRGPGSTYPIFEHHTMMNIANRVFGSLESAQGGKLKERGLAAAEAIFNAHTNKLKVVIAIGRTLESGGRSDQGQRLFQSVTEAIEGLLWNSDGICGIQLLVLVVRFLLHAARAGPTNHTRLYITIIWTIKFGPFGSSGSRQGIALRWVCIGGRPSSKHS